jgi:hypothetical protein
MAGVKLDQPGRVSRDESHLLGPVVRNWGAPELNRCFQRYECSWKVPGGGVVSVDVDSHRVAVVRTTARRWSTDRGIKVGSSEAELLSAYPHAIEGEACTVKGTHDGLFVVGPKGNTTMFEINRLKSSVRVITILAYDLESVMEPC